MSDELKREVGVFDVVINVLNLSVASGIFLFPAILAGILGSAGILAYILCGFLFLLVVLCYAEISSRITATGGTYVYIEKAFGPFAGFIANTLFWFGTGVFVTAALVNGLTDMLSVPFPVFNNIFYRAVFFIVIISFCATVNIIGIKQGMRTVKILTALKLLPLILLVIAGLYNMKFSNLQWTGFPEIHKLGAASLILFFAFAGGETVLNISGEMKNPKRTGPLGLLIGTILIILFFCLIQLTAQGVMGDALVNHKEAPLAAMAETLFGKTGFTILIIAAMVSIFGTMNSVILLFPRILYAGAENKLLPAYLAKVHPKYSTPHRAIIIFSFIAFVIAISGGFRQLAILVTASILLLYIGVVLAVIKTRLQKKENTPASFNLPGGLSIPVAALITLCWFLWQLKSNELIGIGIFIGIISVIYFLRKLINKK
jgi:amino acid transporter